MDVSFLLKISDPTTVYIYSCWVSAQFSCTTNSTVLTLQMSKYVSCLSFGSLGKTNWPTKGATCSRNLVKFSLTRLVTHNFLIVCCGAILWVRVTQRRMTELQQRQWARYIWAKPFYKWRSKGLGRHSSVPTFSFAVGQYITISMTDSQIVRKKVVNVDPIGSQIIWHFKASRLLITPYLGTRSIGRKHVETSDSHCSAMWWAQLSHTFVTTYGCAIIQYNIWRWMWKKWKVLLLLFVRRHIVYF